MVSRSKAKVLQGPVYEPLDPTDPRSPHHPGQKQAWLELARAIGRWAAAQELSEQAGDQNDKGSTLRKTVNRKTGRVD